MIGESVRWTEFGKMKEAYRRADTGFNSILFKT